MDESEVKKRNNRIVKNLDTVAIQKSNEASGSKDY